MPTAKPDFVIEPGGGGGGCYLSGTRIATPDGAVCVEDLSVGMLVLTAAGESRPVRWLGHASVNSTRYRDPSIVWPICIRAGAFADHLPVRDLYVTPGHGLLMQDELGHDMLIYAGNLLNGATIVRVPRERFQYWHVELDSHDILLAEGLPAESYLDMGNRTDFANGGAFIESHPEFKPKLWSDTCVPLVREGPRLHSARARLLARAKALGHVMTQDPDLYVLADGKRIDPVPLEQQRVAFNFPAHAASIELRCRRYTPAHMVPDSDDSRALGICVRRMQRDGVDVALDDESAWSEGWYAPEAGPDAQRWRWSTAQAALPAGTRQIILDILDWGHYWLESEPESSIRQSNTARSAG